MSLLTQVFNEKTRDTPHRIHLDNDPENNSLLAVPQVYDVTLQLVHMAYAATVSANPETAPYFDKGILIFLHTHTHAHTHAHTHLSIIFYFFQQTRVSRRGRASTKPKRTNASARFVFILSLGCYFLTWLLWPASLRLLIHLIQLTSGSLKRFNLEPSPLFFF